MKKVLLVIKKIVMSLCMLYTFNLIISATGTIIQINYFSIAFTSIFGLPAIFGLLILSNLI